MNVTEVRYAKRQRAKRQRRAAKLLAAKKLHVAAHKAAGGYALITRNVDTGQDGALFRLPMRRDPVFIAWDNLGYNDKAGYFDTSTTFGISDIWGPA